EVEKWSKMKIHPNVVPMLGACIHTEKPFLVMPYYQHGNLASFLCIHTDVSVKQRVKWMFGLAAGLHFIHEHGIIHGDLKGDNVLLDNELHVRITDFGLSQIKRAGSSSTQQSVAKKMTEAVRWIAPERYSPKFRLDRPYDVFAYGMTCYQILTGLVPFHEENHRDIITKWIEKGATPDRTDDRPVPETVWLLFEACIKKEPAERPKLPEVKERLKNSLYYTHLEGELLTVAPQRQAI
ncbi:kinase-like domain-containing protein, partial [Gorgonomyces haynaldii]